MRVLATIEPQGVNSLGEQGEWEEIELAVDSAATAPMISSWSSEPHTSSGPPARVARSDVHSVTEIGDHSTMRRIIIKKTQN